MMCTGDLYSRIRCASIALYSGSARDLEIRRAINRFPLSAEFAFKIGEVIHAAVAGGFFAWGLHLEGGHVRQQSRNHFKVVGHVRDEVQNA